MHFAQPGATGPACYPTCHSHTQTLDEYDLVVGLNTGEGEHRFHFVVGYPRSTVVIRFGRALNAVCVAALPVAGSSGAAHSMPLAELRPDNAAALTIGAEREQPRAHVALIIPHHTMPHLNPPPPLAPSAVVLMSLRAQLRTNGALGRPAASISLNLDGSINASRCVAAAWVPGAQGRSFVTAHRDGGVYLHHKVSH